MREENFIKVSIVTVSLNSEKFIKDTIESVLAQRYPWIEYIIIDGKSSDNTLAIVKGYEPCFKGRMKWLSEKDEGLYDAMNKGISLSSGDIIGIINSDDWYENDIIIEVVERIKGFDLLHGNMRFVDEDGRELKTYTHKKGLIRKYISTPFNHPTMFVKRKVYEELGSYRRQLATAADYDFMLRFCKSGFKDVYCNQVIANMRTVGITSSAGTAIKTDEVIMVLKDNGVPYPLALLFIAIRKIRAKAFELLKNQPLAIMLLRRLSGYHVISRDR